MALFKCPECSSMISECADSCPHCGFPLADYYRWVKYQRSFGFDPLEYLSCDRLPIKVLINCEDRYPIEYEGVYLPNQHRIYAYNKVNEFLLTGVVIPGTGVYIARVENKNSFPLLYMATAKEDGSPGWYYGEYGEGIYN